MPNLVVTLNGFPLEFKIKTPSVGGFRIIVPVGSPSQNTGGGS